MLLTLLLNCLAFFGTFSVQLMLSSPNAYLTNARVSVTLFPSFPQNLMLFLCRIPCEIASGQIRDSKIKECKKLASPPSWVQFCTLIPKICLVLSSTVVSHYYNCCTDGSTSLGNYRHPLLFSINYTFTLSMQGINRTSFCRVKCNMKVPSKVRMFYSEFLVFNEQWSCSYSS
jgi:hypothetical protein